MRFVVLLCLLFPIVTDAAVVINEVAWMGSAASANHEWIELYNDGSAVAVDGWTLSDGMNLNIPLTGTIPAQSYAVLERSSDASAAGTAFLIYTGALVNTGAVLQLKRGDGGIEDQVAGGENWVSIGGDNLTKETAQYTTTGWVTGVGTPGARNSGTPKTPDKPTTPPEEDKDDDKVDTPKPLTSKSSGETVRLVLPGMTLKLAVDAQKIGYVHQPITFRVTPSGVGTTLVDSLTYEWNFGDGTTAFSKEPIHSYAFPGTYVVTVYGGYKRQEQVARHEITILPVTLSLTVSPQGNLQIHNESPYDIDISGYQVNGGKQFIFPDRSIMLPNQTITLESKVIGSAYVAVVKDAAGIVVTTKEKSKIEDTPTVATAPEKQTSIRVIETNLSKVTAWHAPLLPPDSDTLDAALKNYLMPDTVYAESKPISSASSTEQSAVPQNAWPYLGLLGVIMLGLFGSARSVLRNQTE
jgi:hypothetical protein